MSVMVAQHPQLVLLFQLKITTVNHVGTTKVDQGAQLQTTLGFVPAANQGGG